jgi:hypothetical protein
MNKTIYIPHASKFVDNIVRNDHELRPHLNYVHTWSCDTGSFQVNALARNVVEELPALLTSLEADPAVKVVVFASGL